MSLPRLNLRIEWAFVLCLGLFAIPLPAIDIELDDPFPVEDQVVGVRVSDDGAAVSGLEVTVHYNPNSITTATEVLDPTDESGRTEWTPTTPGVVQLAVREPGVDTVLANLNAAVRFPHFKPSGVAIMIIAALLLFGGALTGLRTLMRPESQPLPDPPST